MPLDVEVESELTLLLVDDSPVDSEVTPLRAVLTPVDADVESDVMLLFVEERPVESEVTPL
jgi:hypothetical protein